MRRISRIRWSADERAALIRRCQSLRATHPDASIASLLEKGQSILPPERRRANNAPLRKWLAQELRNAPAAPSEPTIYRPEPSAEYTPAAAQAPAEAGASPATPPVAATVAAESTSSPPAASPVVTGLIEAGVQVVVGILSDPRTRSALAGFLQGMPGSASGNGAPGEGTPKSSASASSNGNATQTAAPAAAERRDGVVVIAGLSPEEARQVERSLDGTLQVRFWSPDQPREQLQGWLRDARLVIGMGGMLSPAIEASLERLGQAYVRHNDGMSGLYRRLASEALR